MSWLTHVFPSLCREQILTEIQALFDHLLHSSTSAFAPLGSGVLFGLKPVEELFDDRQLQPHMSELSEVVRVVLYSWVYFNWIPHGLSPLLWQYVPACSSRLAIVVAHSVSPLLIASSPTAAPTSSDCRSSPPSTQI